MDSAEDLVGFTPSHQPELTVIVNASCAEVRALSPPFEEFWAGVGLYAGDFDLTIYRTSTETGTFRDRCAAYCAKRHETHEGPAPTAWTREALEHAGWLGRIPEAGGYDDPDSNRSKEPFNWTGSSVGVALWTMGKFQRLCWDWKRMDERAGPSVAASDQRTKIGSSFIARLFVNLQWNHGLDDIDAIETKAKSELTSLPEPSGGIRRWQFSAMIDEDLSRLRGLCGSDGVLANALVKDPHSEIQRSITARATGNELRACIETDTEWYGIDFVTS